MSTTLGIINPSTEKEITSINLASIEETDAAIDKAAKVAPAWKKVTPADRARLLRRFADVVDSHNEELAQLEVANSGHTISNARWEAGNVRDVLNYYSGAPERHSGKQIPVAGGIDLTFYEPLGVVGIIVPWNFPMPIAGWGFAPALAAGNTVVLKPATLTPLTAIRLAELGLQVHDADAHVGAAEALVEIRLVDAEHRRAVGVDEGLRVDGTPERALAHEGRRGTVGEGPGRAGRGGDRETLVSRGRHLGGVVHDVLAVEEHDPR